MSRDADTDRMPLDDVLQPDVIRPSQCLRHVRVLRDPERRLRLAVLDDAIRYVQRYLDSTDRREQALYEDAVDWFVSPDRSEPLSFENVCEALELDADYIRQGLCHRRHAEGTRLAYRPEPRGDTNRISAPPRGRLGRQQRAA